METLFRIRRKRDGLFFQKPRGYLSWVSWTKRGRTYMTLAALKVSMRSYHASRDGLELVEYLVLESGKRPLEEVLE